MGDWENKREHAIRYGRANRAALSAAAEVVRERDALGDQVTFAIDARIDVLRKALLELQRIGPVGR